ncbi:F0F1 ATP synthase subunit delta [Candidatus Pantoea edessiphila]|uniref:ATP synthase subunit delta n=1 Tax=Candidatus Pantoea edessiphila TaxID=2044610 RepID=A0A2P5SXA1_9GAMM|nr:F0F1 ATP synthase subunit delta [Candidatus Pantoea edessiphila]MBK4775850.1 F0F1 ATP synthase subunit delta [Pantoea sp. Edef]PPI86961.1 F0F1 ATP synthase subunit delta [Candidatus Pantoea edessiphila]
MFELITIARPYAKAIFDISLENKNIEYWHRVLIITAQISADKEIKKIFSRGLSANNIYDIFDKICGDKLSQSAKNLIKLMAENKRLDILPAVLSEFDKLHDDYKSIAEATVTSAFNLSNEQLKNIKHLLEKRLARKVRLKNKTDISLISGIIINLGDLVIDNSISGRISRLAKILQY